MTTSQTTDPAPTCDRCREPLNEREIALGWPVYVPGVSWKRFEAVCPLCYGDDAFCGICCEVLRTFNESGRCPSRYLLRVSGGGDYDLTATTEDAAIAEAEAMIVEGDYPEDGCIVYAHIMPVDCLGVVDRHESTPIEVKIEPSHDIKIKRVMGDAGCGLSPDDHDWDATADVDGGCRQNPGVWSLGGTTMRYCDHCTRCGLRREWICHGEQRNHGQADSVEYSAESLCEARRLHRRPTGRIAGIVDHRHRRRR